MITMAPYASYFIGNFLERFCYNITNQVFKVSNLITFLYSENVVYPYVSLHDQKKGLILENIDFAEIIKISAHFSKCFVNLKIYSFNP